MRQFSPVKKFRNEWIRKWIDTNANLMLKDHRELWEEYHTLAEEKFDEFWENFKPKRSTKHSACYDLRSAENVIIEPFFKTLFQHTLSYYNTNNRNLSFLELIKVFNKIRDMSLEEIDELDLFCDVKPTLVSTGIKVYMEEDEVLKIYNRSSNPIKRGLIVPNSVGIIDHDYADNPSNEGEIFLQFWNFSNDPIEIYIGDRIGQAMFNKYLVVDDDDADGDRVGGFGSTGHK
jgi:dUTP pyrophosphatase